MDELQLPLLNVDWIKEFGLFRDAVLSFFHAVDWSERWILALLGFHLLMFLFLFVTRKNMSMQIFAFFFVLLLNFFAPLFNDWARENYRLFARQNYFGRSGSFLAITLSGPLIFQAIFIVVNFLVELGRLLVLVKRRQIREKQAAQAKKST